MKKVAIVGAGLIGLERLNAVKLLEDCGREIKITGIYDPYHKKINEIAKQYNVNVFSDVNELIKTEPEWVFVAIPHDTAPPIVSDFLQRGFKVLIEKPLGRSVEEAETIMKSIKYPDQLFVGFNYRYYDCISMALKDAANGVFGDLISVDIVMGHGGSPELANSWKIDPIRAGGGCILDPGIHLLDLCRIIAKGKIKPVSGVTWEGFWKTGIEEEAHILLEGDKFLINLQISIARWRSTFILAIRGKDGYGIVSGRGRYYGRQSYTRGKRWGWQSGVSQRDSEELILGTASEDSFTKELNALFYPDKSEFLKPCTASEALETMKLWESILKVVKPIGK